MAKDVTNDATHNITNDFTNVVAKNAANIAAIIVVIANEGQNRTAETRVHVS